MYVLLTIEYGCLWPQIASVWLLKYCNFKNIFDCSSRRTPQLLVARSHNSLKVKKDIWRQRSPQFVVAKEYIIWEVKEWLFAAGEDTLRSIINTFGVFCRINNHMKINWKNEKLFKCFISFIFTSKPCFLANKAIIKLISLSGCLVKCQD